MIVAPSCGLQLGRRSLGNHCPWSMTTMFVREPVGLLEVLRRQQQRGALATSSSITPQRSVRPLGSRPVVGSSRNNTGGRCTSAAARSSRRRMPPEYVRTGRSRRVDQIEPFEQLVRAGADVARSACATSLPTMRRFSCAGQVLVDGGVLPREADALAHGLADHASRRCRALRRAPASGARIVVSTRTAVVLPAPLGPSSPSTVPVGTREVDAVERDDIAEPLLESLDDDRVTVMAGSLSDFLE